MARARQIKPTFFIHEEVASLSIFTRLYWIGLWTLADRDGRLEYRPMRIKAQLFPYEAADIETSTLELESKGFVQRYKSEDGRILVQVTNWDKHQRPHQNESESEFPPMVEGLAPLEQALVLEPCILNLEPCILNPEPRTLNLEPVSPAKPERKPRVTKPKMGTLEEILGGGTGTPIWESYWKLVAIFGGQPKNPAPRTTAKQYADALAAGVEPARIQTQAQIFRNGTSEIKYMPQLSKWLDGQGYLTPDLPKSTGATHGTNHSPSHRAGVDAAYLEQVNARLANAAPQPEPTDEELLSLYGRPA